MNYTIAGNHAHFSWVDHTMFALMLVVSTVVGVLIGVCGKQDTKVDYLLGGKKMSVIPIAVSLIFSHVSGISIVALPTEYYTYGAMYFNQFFAGLITCIITISVFLPIFFELQITSTYEYLELRFDKNVRTMASFLFACSLILYLPIVIYTPALAFNEVSGLSVHLVTSVVCIVCMLYTMLGGMKAVVWTDFLQSFVTVSSCIAIICVGLAKTGGFNVMWDRSGKGGRLEIFDFNPDPFERNTYWTVVVGSTFHWMFSLGINQGMVQKFIALPSLKKARLSLVIFFFGYLLMKTLVLLIGLVIYSNYYQCDPVTSKVIDKADQIVPFFAMDAAAHIPGLPGLFVAGIFSACLSTLSSNFNCLSATIFEDFISPLIKGKKSFESKIPYILKGIVILTGMICLLMVLVVEKMGGIFQVASTLAGITSGATLGMFFLGMFIPWANWKGCLAGSITSLVIMTWITTGAQVYKGTGIERFPYAPMSTEGCEEIFNFTAPVTPTRPAGVATASEETSPGEQGPQHYLQEWETTPSYFTKFPSTTTVLWEQPLS
ncbi:sodium-coupled monocarboxylate transporter 1-like isoform X2 [Bacillus rossius redtenbacheri]|uniref:sodium-coupled monocarboxylate transporter 1-like isoform X2 n=1 Tax=Bacillus rossius redtenbacheri TaxID=93214 RepID=UPI002FDD3BA9